MDYCAEKNLNSFTDKRRRMRKSYCWKPEFLNRFFTLLLVCLLSYSNLSTYFLLINYVLLFPTPQVLFTVPLPVDQDGPAEAQPDQAAGGEPKVVT